MAEVRKKVLNDKYDTSKIKTNNSKEKKVAKKDSQKKDKKADIQKKGLLTKFRIFCNGVKSEFLKVHWTSKKDMFKFSIATIVFIVFCSLFFYIIEVLFALVQSLIG